ncbi:MAG: hypothetical protein SVT52_00215 [Planctomycetota bacterium]|nr:hypothetical protein [Planctomycetota bacterium]
MTAKKWITAGAGLAVLASAGVSAWMFWPRPSPPNPAEQSPAEIVKYMASKQFARLPESQRKEYFNEVRQAKPDRSLIRRTNFQELTETERTNLRRNVRPLFQRMMDEQVEKYFELPEADRTAYLDGFIDRMQERAARRDRASERPGGSRRRRFDATRIRRRIDSTTPAKRARRSEFFKKLRERMERRGIKFPFHRRR